MSYLPPDSFEQVSATFWIEPPGWMAMNHLSDTGPPLSPPQPAARTEAQATAAANATILERRSPPPTVMGGGYPRRLHVKPNG